MYSEIIYFSFSKALILLRQNPVFVLGKQGFRSPTATETACWAVPKPTEKKTLRASFLEAALHLLSLPLRGWQVPLGCILYNGAYVVFHDIVQIKTGTGALHRSPVPIFC